MRFDLLVRSEFVKVAKRREGDSARVYGAIEALRSAVDDLEAALRIKLRKAQVPERGVN